MKFLKRLLLIVVLVVCFLIIYSWLNLWLPKNTIGIFYDDKDSNSAPTLIEKHKFYWNWKRIIPYYTSLTIITTNLEKHEQTLTIYLPNAYSLSNQINRSADTFKTVVNINLLYTLDKANILEYITNDDSRLRLESAYNFKHQLINAIEKQYAILAKNDLVLSESSPHIDNFTQSLNSMLIPKINTSLASLPIKIDSIDLEILQLPDLSLYHFVTSSNDIKNEFSDITKEGNTTSLWLSQYLLFIKELAGIADAYPSTIDILKILPPTLLKESIGE